MKFYELTDYLYLDDTSPSGIRWSQDRYGGEYYSVIRAEKDAPAGCINSLGYWQVCVDGDILYVHRVIWEIYYGKNIQGEFIDHLNGNKLDNTIGNLRLVTQKENNRNVSKRSDNTSGSVGVTRDNRVSSPRYIAHWSGTTGKRLFKSFSIKKYGEELAEFLAKEYRLHQIDLLNLQGAGYTARHGS